jgi:hypothetical protein
LPVAELHVNKINDETEARAVNDIPYNSGKQQSQRA